MQGFIYCLSCPIKKGVYKIGYSRNVIDRVKSLNRETSCVLPMSVVLCKEVNNAKSVEETIHFILDQYRVNNKREYFEVDIKIIESIFSLREGRPIEPNILNEKIGVSSQPVDHPSVPLFIPPSQPMSIAEAIEMPVQPLTTLPHFLKDTNETPDTIKETPDVEMWETATEVSSTVSTRRRRRNVSNLLFENQQFQSSKHLNKRLIFHNQRYYLVVDGVITNNYSSLRGAFQDMCQKKSDPCSVSYFQTYYDGKWVSVKRYIEIVDAQTNVCA